MKETIHVGSVWKRPFFQLMLVLGEKKMIGIGLVFQRGKTVVTISGGKSLSTP